MLKLKNRSIIRLFFMGKYRIINREINNFETWKILKNRLKKIKNSGLKATIIYLFFKIRPSKNITENINAITKLQNGLAVACFSNIPIGDFSKLAL